MATAEIEMTTVNAGGHEIFVRRVGGAGTPTVFVHGNPTHSADWEPFMTAVEGPAVAPDLLGFGRSAKPHRFDYSMESLAATLRETIDQLGIDRYRLVVHDWGGLALLCAMSAPTRLERLVVINAVPFLPGYRWHWVAQIWRRRGIGEFFNAITTRRAMAILFRQARPGFRAFPREFVDTAWSSYDRRTRRAVLGLYRSADPDKLAEAGQRLGLIDCPALVIWGASDPYLPTRFGEEYARRLPNADYERVENAGHWPWIDKPELIGRVSSFLSAPS